MRKINTSIIIFFWVVSLIFLNGCATSIPFVEKNIASISPIQVMRFETPAFRKSSAGSRTAIMLPTIAVAVVGGYTAGSLFTAVAIGGAAGTVGAIAEKSIGEAEGKKTKEQLSLPDFGELVVEKFIERAEEEIPNWPQATVDTQPISRQPVNPPNTLILFKIKAWGIHSPIGFHSITNAKMIDSGGNLLWEKSFTYTSRKFNRNSSLDEFEADNGKSLKDEIKFAVEQTVSDFIGHFKAEKD